jgi:hypothetical protein
VVEPRGYVLIRVGKDHPLADCRGYAYEHRLKAAAAGQQVTAKHVHHDDEVRSNNAPDNLEALTSAEHRKRHRKPGSKLRDPGEENPEIVCLCGCGRKFLKYDATGRPKAYVSGHNVQPRPTMDAIINALGATSGCLTIAALQAAVGTTRAAIKSGLTKLRAEGLAEPISHGKWHRIMQ